MNAGLPKANQQPLLNPVIYFSFSVFFVKCFVLPLLRKYGTEDFQDAVLNVPNSHETFQLFVREFDYGPHTELIT